MNRTVLIFAAVVVAIFTAALLLPVFRESCGVSRITAESNAILLSLQQYKERFGAYPTGTNEKIYSALSGRNKDNVIFIRLPKQAIGQNGAFLDPWGTPYEIYFSELGPLIRSAGKDHVFTDRYVRWSDDYYAW